MYTGKPRQEPTPLINYFIPLYVMGAFCCIGVVITIVLVSVHLNSFATAASIASTTVRSMTLKQENVTTLLATRLGNASATQKQFATLLMQHMTNASASQKQMAGALFQQLGSLTLGQQRLFGDHSDISQLIRNRTGRV